MMMIRAVELESCQLGDTCLVGYGVNPTFHSHISMTDHSLHQISHTGLLQPTSPFPHHRLCFFLSQKQQGPGRSLHPLLASSSLCHVTLQPVLSIRVQQRLLAITFSPSQRSPTVVRRRLNTPKPSLLLRRLKLHLSKQRQPRRGSFSPLVQAHCVANAYTANVSASLLRSYK